MWDQSRAKSSTVKIKEAHKGRFRVELFVRGVVVVVLLFVFCSSVNCHIFKKCWFKKRWVRTHSKD